MWLNDFEWKKEAFQDIFDFFFIFHDQQGRQEFNLRLSYFHAT